MTAPTIEEVMQRARECANKLATPANWYGLQSAIEAYAEAKVRERTEECMAVCDEIGDEYQRKEAQVWSELKTDAQEGARDCRRAIRAKFLAGEPGDTLADQIAQAKADRATWPQWLDPDFRDRSAVPPKPGDGREEG